MSLEKDSTLDVLKREVAEALGYRAVMRAPRGSLREFCEVTSPDGISVVGSASAIPAADEDHINTAAWEDALRRLPDWTGDLDVAMALIPFGLRVVLVQHAQGSAQAAVGDSIGDGHTLAEAVCRAWLRLG